jgi:hypothetical protein
MSIVTKSFCVVLALGLAACGSTASFGLSSEDNDPDKLAAALQRVEAPKPGPVNKLGKPLAFLAARGKPKELIAFDLEAKKELWRVPADVASKVVVGSEFVACIEGKALVGRDVTSGKKLWKVDIDGTFIGAAADSNNVYYTAKTGSRTWSLIAVDGTSGSQLWDAEAPGALGAPAARGGLVFSPFLKQWLAILDAHTGKQLTRIRGEDEEISFVRATPSAVYFGSKAGVFFLDERAASGKRDKSTYGSAALPEEFVRVHYHWDAFDPIQAGYSAYDRNRVLWRGEPAGDKLAFKDDRVVVHTYRFFFGFSASSGELVWAYNHPRVDIVASAQLGTSIGITSMLGDIGALDPATGRRIYSAKVKGQLLGATFDADGWAPDEKIGDALGTAAALASIARDRDARFNEVKKFAVTALSQLKGGDVTKDLLVLIQNPKTPAYLVQTAGQVLVDRKDPKGLPHLVEALEVRHDFVEGTKPMAVGVVAEALAVLDSKTMPAKQRKKAVEGLLAQLRDPQTPIADLVHLVHALGALGTKGELAELASFLLVYRADPSFATHVDAVSATIDVLLRDGGMGERELVSFVANDARTQSGVAEYARRALLQKATPAATEDTSKKGKKASGNGKAKAEGKADKAEEKPGKAKKTDK